MREFSKDQIVTALTKLPYPQQVSGIDFSGDGEVRFTWRSTTFRVSLTGSVEEVQGSMLSGSNTAMLMEHILLTEMLRDELFTDVRHGSVR